MKFKITCRMCGRKVEVNGLWMAMTRAPFCPASDLSGCLATYKAMHEQPPVEEDLGEGDDVPIDIGVCSECKGHGEVPFRQDWSTGAIETERCPRCIGTGSEYTCRT